MSKLISKIEEKLGGSNSAEEQNRLQKAPPGTSSTGSSALGGTSKGSNGTTGTEGGAVDQLRHPVSSTSGAPTGTSIDNKYNSPSTTSTSGDGTQGLISSMRGGHSSVPEQHSTMPGQHSSLPVQHSTLPGGQASGGTTTRTEPREPVNPYSSTGQQVAATRGSNVTYPATGVQDRGMRTGGDVEPIAGDPRMTNTTNTTNIPPQTTSDHHYGRDAGVVGGAGAAGLGAYEVGRQSGPSNTTHLSRETMNNPGHQGMYESGRNPLVDDPARSHGAGVLGTHTQTGGIPREDSAEEKAKKMSDAYQAGYRDAMEHMKSGR